MRRRTLMGGFTPGPIIAAWDSVACDVCLYDKVNEQLVIVSKNDFDARTYPPKYYSPVGVVVVPGTHNVYGETGPCGVMSLVEMSYETPDTGSITQKSIYFGEIPDSTVLPYFEDSPVVGTLKSGSSTTEGDLITITTTERYVTLPSDNNYGLKSPVDTDAYYHTSASGTKYFAPSPYLDDDTRNPAYYQTSSPSSAGNALSDFNGKTNTNTLITLATSQSDWKTASTITNNSGTGYYPAACCCWRYHTDGTKQGDWYLPSAGEFGYVITKLKQINDTITNLLSVYGSDKGVAINTGDEYLTSTIQTKSSETRFYTGYGRIVGNLTYGSTEPCRAFLRFSYKGGGHDVDP